MGKFPPKWFDLNNYTVTRKFQRKQWRDAFEIRRDLYRDYLMYTNEAREAGVNLREYHSSEVVRLRDELIWHSRHVGDVINRIEVDDVYLGCGAASGSLNVFLDLEYVFLRRTLDGEKMEDIINDFPGEIVDVCNRTVYIDFSRTDEAIIEDFKKWLGMRREQLGYYPSVKPLSPAAIRRLYGGCVLPYLDLRLNEFFHGMDKRVYKWREYTEVLFPPDALPDGSVDENKVRKYTDAMAIRILNSDVQLFDPC